VADPEMVRGELRLVSARMVDRHGIHQVHLVEFDARDAADGSSSFFCVSRARRCAFGKAA